jgi:hypothetical protein
MITPLKIKLKKEKKKKKKKKKKKTKKRRRKKKKEENKKRKKKKTYKQALMCTAINEVIREKKNFKCFVYSQALFPRPYFER